MAVKNVLLVDDSKSARLVLRKLLEKNSLKVDLAESAEDAFSYLASHQPDAIFMDHLMPGMDGLEAAEVISKNPNTKSIPIVMCTSKEGDDFVQSAKQHGAVDILPKPPSPGLVAQVLRNISDHCERSEEKLSVVAAEPATSTKPSTSAKSSMPTEASTPKAAAADAEQNAEMEGLARKVAEKLLDERMNDGEIMQRWVGPVLEQALIKLKQEVKEITQTVAQDAAQALAAKESQEIKASIQNLYGLIEKQVQVQGAEVQDNSQLEAVVASVKEKLNGLCEAEYVEQKVNALREELVANTQQQLSSLEPSIEQSLEQSISATLKSKLSGFESSLSKSLQEKINISLEQRLDSQAEHNEDQDGEMEARISERLMAKTEQLKQTLEQRIKKLESQTNDNGLSIKNLQLVESQSENNTTEIIDQRLQSLEKEILNKSKSHTQSVADNVFQLIEDIQPSINQDSLDLLKGEMVELLQSKETELTKKTKKATLMGAGIGVFAALTVLVATLVLP